MKNLVEKSISLFTFHIKNTLLVIIKYSLCGLQKFVKFHIKLLYIISENRIFYLIYIFLVMYSFFGYQSDMECTSSHYVSLSIVLYLINASLEIFLICKISITRNWLNTLVGKEYTVKYSAGSSKQLLKYCGVIFGLTACELITQYFNFEYINHKFAISEEIYENAYGSDAQKWDEEIKNEYLKQQMDLLHLNNGRGLMTNIAQKLNIESLYSKIIQTVSEILKQLRK